MLVDLPSYFDYISVGSLFHVYVVLRIFFGSKMKKFFVIIIQDCIGIILVTANWKNHVNDRDV